MQQIYIRTPMPKFDFNKAALQLYWNHTIAWVFSCKFGRYFQNTFFTLLCGASKGFIKAFEAFIKPFETPQRSVKIKI